MKTLSLIKTAPVTLSNNAEAYKIGSGCSPESTSVGNKLNRTQLSISVRDTGYSPLGGRPELACGR